MNRLERVLIKQAGKKQKLWQRLLKTNFCVDLKLFSEKEQAGRPHRVLALAGVRKSTAAVEESCQYVP